MGNSASAVTTEPTTETEVPEATSGVFLSEELQGE